MVANLLPAGELLGTLKNTLALWPRLSVFTRLVRDSVLMTGSGES